MQLVPVNDTHTFINGTWRFMQDLAAPWRASCVAERYIRGKWFREAINRQYNDLCKVWHSPSEPFYEVSKTQPGCPMKSGVKKIKIFLLNFPSSVQLFMLLGWMDFRHGSPYFQSSFAQFYSCSLCWTLAWSFRWWIQIGWWKTIEGV